MLKLKLGSIGDKVRYIQLMLNIKQDGLFGEQTDTAVKEFQISNNLIPDGIVGIKTLDALESLDSQSNQIINNIPYIKNHLPYGEYSKYTTSKDYLFLHHTAGWNDPYRTIKDWGRDSRGMVGTEFVIGGMKVNSRNTFDETDGLILQAFPTGHFAWHLGKNGCKDMHTNSVGIELNSFGYLKDGLTYTGARAVSSQVCKLNESFKGYKNWHRYSDKQIKSLKELCLFIAERDNIDVREGLPNLIRDKGVKAFEFNKDAYNGKIRGLLTHTNTNKGKFDCFPQQELIDMLLSL